MGGGCNAGRRWSESSSQNPYNSCVNIYNDGVCGHLGEGGSAVKSTS